MIIKILQIIHTYKNHGCAQVEGAYRRIFGGFFAAGPATEADIWPVPLFDDKEQIKLFVMDFVNRVREAFALQIVSGETT